jgi:hypothetical protein
MKRQLVTSVTFYVALKLGNPILASRARNSPLPATWVLVPETSMHKNYLQSSGKNEIRLAGQTSDVQPVSVTQAIYEPPDNHFRTRVLTSDTAHIFRAALWGKSVQSINTPGRAAGTTCSSLTAPWGTCRGPGKNAEPSRRSNSFGPRGQRSWLCHQTR